MADESKNRLLNAIKVFFEKSSNTIIQARALYNAVWNECDEEKVSRILDNNRKLLNKVIDKEWGAGVLHCATEKGLTKIVQQLLQRKNIDVNMLNKNGCTPLYYSCSFGHVEVAKLLLDHKARTDLARKVLVACVNIDSNGGSRWSDGGKF